jgi:molybdenum cofactor guanylyltransferase
MRESSVAAAILAGGAARRLGGIDKGLALYCGRPLIAHVVQAIAPQVDALLIIANRHLDDYAAYARVLSDRHGGYRGPLEGIATALECCTHEWLLTVPVDSPDPGADLLQRLWRARAGADIVVAHDGERRQPLFALYCRQRTAMPDLGRDPDLPVWAWQDAHVVHEVDFGDSAARFANLNTVEDFRDADE